MRYRGATNPMRVLLRLHGDRAARSLSKVEPGAFVFQMGRALGKRVILARLLPVGSIPTRSTIHADIAQ